jgi:hypothetical protein
MPLLKVDPGAIIDVEHLATLGRTLPELLQGEPFERVHVVLLLACELIGRRQMRESMGPQIEGKEVARGILDTIVRGRRVMRGGGVKVTVARMDLERGTGVSFRIENLLVAWRWAEGRSGVKSWPAKHALNISLDTAMGRTTDDTDDTDSESSGWWSVP